MVTTTTDYLVLNANVEPVKPAKGKIVVYLDKKDGRYKAKRSDGSVVLIE